MDLEVYKFLFGLSMISLVCWIGTGYYRGPRRWVYALNRYFFCIWTVSLMASMFFAFRMV